MRLYHYTCRVAARAIGRRGMLRTWGHIHFRLGEGFPVVWLTDMEVPEPVGLGLHNRTRLRHYDGTVCNRMEVRYIVETTEAVSWLEWARDHGVSENVRRVLEEGRAPERWFIAETAQLAIMDRTYIPPRGGESNEVARPGEIVRHDSERTGHDSAHVAPPGEENPAAPGQGPTPRASVLARPEAP